MVVEANLSPQKAKRGGDSGEHSGGRRAVANSVPLVSDWMMLTQALRGVRSIGKVVGLLMHDDDGR